MRPGPERKWLGQILISLVAQTQTHQCLCAAKDIDTKTPPG